MTNLVINNHKVLLALFVYVADSCEEQTRCRILLPLRVEAEYTNKGDIRRTSALRAWRASKIGKKLTSSAMSAISVLSDADMMCNYKTTSVD